jgi:hypothetical protein
MAGLLATWRRQIKPLLPPPTSISASKSHGASGEMTRTYFNGWTFEEAAFQADIAAFRERLRSLPKPYVRLKPKSDAEQYQSDRTEEARDGWAFEKGE